MAAVPEEREALCFGNVAVPINNMNVGDADGNFKVVPMVELDSTACCHAWLWKQLGVKYEDFKHGRPGSLPLVKEIKTSIMAVRGKRKRDGKFYNEDGRPTPPVPSDHCERQATGCAHRPSQAGARHRDQRAHGLVRE